MIKIGDPPYVTIHRKPATAVEIQAELQRRLSELGGAAGRFTRSIPVLAERGRCISNWMMPEPFEAPEAVRAVVGSVMRDLWLVERA